MKKIKRIFIEALWAVGSIKNFPTYLGARLKLFGEKKLYLKMRNGVQYTVRADTPEVMIIEEIWHQNVYDRLMSYIHHDSIVIDIGANVGIFSVKAALAAKNARVLSYEPVPANVAVLKENIALNHLEGRVEVNQLGVAGNAGEASLFYQEHDSGGGSLQQYGNHSASMKIQCLTLADIFRDKEINRCDFMKIDCEGAEEGILFNTPPELFRKIRSMTIEWHDILSKLPIGDFRAFLEKAGYTVELGSNTPMVYAYQAN